MLEQYSIDYSRNPLESWLKLKTIQPSLQELDSLYEFSKSTSRYHFDTNISDIDLLDSDCPALIPITRFADTWSQDLKQLDNLTQPATWAFRTTTRFKKNNQWEENDFRRWGYNIDGDYAICNRINMPNLPESLQDIVDAFGFESTIIKYDVQMPGQCFYWHLDAFGGALKRFRGDFDNTDISDIDQRDHMRVVVFLEDQKNGQMWQQGNLLLSWKKGDCITWPWKDIPHGTTNYGHDPRPVLNITGRVTNKTRDFLKNV